jgi:hypothetical protein
MTKENQMTDRTTTTWDTVTALIEGRGGKRRFRNGPHRGWDVPSPTGGTFSVEVTLRPRWCSVAIDRIRTTDRREDVAKPWLEEHIWPYVNDALLRRKRVGGYGILPSGHTYAGATPIDRCDVPAVLAAWIDAEMTWGLSEEEQWLDSVVEPARRRS